MNENWYIKHIEEPVRGVVKLLRNNGFNTTASCGHYPKPYIQMTWCQGNEIEKLYNLLIGNDYKNFTIQMYWVHFEDAQSSRHINLEFHVKPRLIKLNLKGEKGVNTNS